MENKLEARKGTKELAHIAKLNEENLAKNEDLKKTSFEIDNEKKHNI